MAGAGRVIASCFALCAFAVAIMVGLSAGNEASEILGRAILAMLVCYPAGLAVAAICSGVVQRHLDQQRITTPGSTEPRVAPADAAPAPVTTPGTVAT